MHISPQGRLLLIFTLILLLSTSGLAQRRSSTAIRSSSARSLGTLRQTRTTSSGEVSVRGYHRRDGTYVAPYKRTAADGDFYNNWSTYGNVNPYTGRPGTKTSPPVGYGQDVWVNGYYRKDGSYVRGHYRSAPDGDPSNNYSSPGNTNPYISELDNRLSTASAGSSLEEADIRARRNVATRLSQIGHAVDWQNYSYYQLSDMEIRIRLAQRLSQLGVPTDWQQHTYYEMSDWEARIRQADRLSQLGLSVSWRDYTYYQMSDWETRIRQAKRLADLGLSADWRQHTYFEMSDWESRMRIAKELERLGAQVDWRQFTYFQLIEIRRSIQKN
jgi:hypothetical protein